MLNLSASTAYKKDLKLCKKRQYDLALLNAVINTLLIPAPLPPINKAPSFWEPCWREGTSHYTRLATNISCQ